MTSGSGTLHTTYTASVGLYIRNILIAKCAPIFSHDNCYFCFYYLEIKTTLIYPATKKHIEKNSAQDVFVIRETAEDYKEITLPFIEESQFSLQVRHAFRNTQVHFQP